MKLKHEISRLTEVKGIIFGILIMFLIVGILPSKSETQTGIPTGLRTINVEMPNPIYKDQYALMTLSFFDFDGNPAAPLSVKYKIHCEDPKRQLLAETTVDPGDLASEIDILVSDTVNRIVKRRPKYGVELHTITVEYTWDFNGTTITSTSKGTFIVQDLDHL